MALRDQVPTQSGFHAKSEGAEVLAELELAGKTAIVTGGYSGLGLETARALAAKGVRVIVPARSREKAEQNLAGIGGEIQLAEMDLGELASVRRFAADNMRVLNFLLSDSLGGGGSASLKTDAQGKTHGLGLLRLRMDVPEAVLSATPAERYRHELSVPIFLAIIAAFTALCLILALL